MEFHWDSDKAQTNLRKHGIAFEDAVRVFDGPIVETIDDRVDYGEVRLNSIGKLDGLIILNVTHTDRDGVTRLISARHASRDERNLFERIVNPNG